jgi:16S rRNA (cytidine1402-2'-O)-methyltransferase
MSDPTSAAKHPGTLYVVATPIGNLDDISVRAQSVLQAVSLIAAEDTRHTRRLLGHLGVTTHMVSCHEHNEVTRIPEILARLGQGDDVALVSDAGTPLISDPGFRLVAAAAEQGLTVSPVPGCSAALAAVSVAGLPTDQLLIAGFLPATTAKRRARLAELGTQTPTLVLFESVHRIHATIEDMIAVLGTERRAVAARELTKRFETLYRGTLGELQAQLSADPGANKGEYTLVVAGAPAAVAAEAGELDQMLRVLLGYLGVRQAADATVKLLGVRRNEAYKRALELREGSDSEY